MGKRVKKQRLIAEQGKSRVHYTCRVGFVNFSSKLSLLDVLVATAIAVVLAKVS